MFPEREINHTCDPVNVSLTSSGKYELTESFVEIYSIKVLVRIRHTLIYLCEEAALCPYFF